MYQRSAITNVATMLTATAAQNQAGLESRRALPILCQVGLPQDRADQDGPTARSAVRPGRAG